MSNTNNKTLLWTLKITAALFQIPATGRVFFDHFAGLSPFEQYFSTILAVALIDILFLYVLWVLESNMTVLAKLPWAVGGFFLLIATLVIGYLDEGWYAWMPRIGFIMLVSIALFGYLTDLLTTYRSIEARAAREKRQRELDDLRHRNHTVRERQKLRKEAFQAAIAEIRPAYIQREIDKEYASLGYSDTPVIIDQKPEELPEGILLLPSGNYAWEHPETGELVDTTTTGKTYTLRGAKLALNRELKK